MNWRALWPFRRKDAANPAVRELVHELVKRIGALEEIQLRREIEWAETKDQVYRHLKRLNAVKQHLDERESSEDASGTTNDKRPAPSAVLAAKFGRSG